MVGENVVLVCSVRLCTSTSAIASVTKDLAIFKECDGKRTVEIETFVRTLLEVERHRTESGRIYEFEYEMDRQKGLCNPI